MTDWRIDVKRRIVLLATLLVLVLTGCINKKEADRPLLITLHEFEADSNGVKLEFHYAAKDDGQVLFYLEYGGEEHVQEGNGEGFYSFNIKEDNLESNTNFKLGVKDKKKGRTMDEMEIQIKDYLVQLNERTVKCVVAQMTDEEKARLVIGYQAMPGDADFVDGVSGFTYPLEKYGIPSLVFSDGPAGVRNPKGSISYPSGTNLAQTWDMNLVKEIGKALGNDARNLKVDILLGPGMNIHRNPLNGRNFEYFSEDPFLTGKIAASYTNGVQSMGVGVSLKHFAANNQETSRGTSSSEVTERALREIYLRGFEIAVKESSPWTIMSSYNKINGKYTSVDKELLTGILREEWGFKGLVMSDWGSQGAADEKVKAQNDLYMPGEPNYVNTVLNALRNGKLTQEEIDRCCVNILSIAAKKSKKTYQSDYKTNAILSRKAAAESVVILKNDSVLPLVKCEVALFGNGQKYTVYTGEGSGFVHTPYNVNIQEGLNNSEYFTLNVDIMAKYVTCRPAPMPKGEELYDGTTVVLDDETIKKAAKDSDVAVFVISRTTTEGADHRNLKGDFYLSEREQDMLEKVSKAFRNQGKKTIVLLNTGNPIEVDSWIDLADAVLYMGYLGLETGNAICDVLSGKVNPSGRLVSTWPSKYEDVPSSYHFPGNAATSIYFEDIYVGYRFYETFEIEPAFEFGYGLSYTSFEYSNFKMTKKGNKIEFKVTVRNTGKRAGRDVVQVYVTKPGSIQEQPKYELVAFAKTGDLKPGKKETLTLVVKEEDLKTYVSDTSRWMVEGGKYVFSIGSSVKKIHKTYETELEEKVIQDVENRCVPVNEFNVLNQKDGLPSFRRSANVALNKKATCNVHEGDLRAQNAVDGSYSTRWSGLAPSNDSMNWLKVDLEAVYDIENIIIFWEACNVFYRVETSVDGTNWTKILEKSSNPSLYDDIKVEGEVRYIRISGEKNGWFSIYELEAFEKAG
jgi:beta-glucosidase